MTSRLGKIVANGGSGDGAAVSRLKRTVLSGRRGELVTVPVIGEVWIELVGHATVNQIEAEVWEAMRALGLELNPITVPTFEAERAARTLARAVREGEPDSRDVTIGTVEEWKSLDPDVINVAWQAYGDVRERLDPLGVVISDTERSELEFALKKKDARLLRSFGVVKLAHYLATTADPPSSSPSPK